MCFNFTFYKKKWRRYTYTSLKYSHLFNSSVLSTDTVHDTSSVFDPHFFFFLFFGGPWSELLEESESESELEEDEEEEEGLELSSLSLLLSSDEEEELEEPLLSEEESLEELDESLLPLLELEEDLFFFVFFSPRGIIPAPRSSEGLFSLSLSFFFNSAVLEGLYRYFLFPVHS